MGLISRASSLNLGARTKIWRSQGYNYSNAAEKSHPRSDSGMSMEDSVVRMWLDQMD